MGSDAIPEKVASKLIVRQPDGVGDLLDMEKTSHVRIGIRIRIITCLILS